MSSFDFFPKRHLNLIQNKYKWTSVFRVPEHSVKGNNTTNIVRHLGGSLHEHIEDLISLICDSVKKTPLQVLELALLNYFGRAKLLNHQ